MANISNNTESWNNHTMGELETHLKSRLNDCEISDNKVTALSSNNTDTQYPSAKCVSTAFDDNELTLMTALSNTLASVNTNLSSHTTTINAALAENEAILMTELAAIETRISALENN